MADWDQIDNEGKEASTDRKFFIDTAMDIFEEALKRVYKKNARPWPNGGKALELFPHETGVEINKIRSEILNGYKQDSYQDYEGYQNYSVKTFTNPDTCSIAKKIMNYASRNLPHPDFHNTAEILDDGITLKVNVNILSRANEIEGKPVN